MIRMIAAVSLNGVIGNYGKIPWHYPPDLANFRAVTTGDTVIMGKNTWDSIGKRPLPHRKNVVVSSSDSINATTARTLQDAITNATGDVWVIGGSLLYCEGLLFASEVFVTIAPINIGDVNKTTKIFPFMPPSVWATLYDGARKTPDGELHFYRYVRKAGTG